MNLRTPGSLWMIDQLDTLTGAQQPLSRFLCSVAYLDLFRVGTWHIPKNVRTLALLSRLVFSEVGDARH